LDKFYNKKEIPWIKLIWNAHYSNGQIPHAVTDKGSFWWRDVLKLCSSGELLPAKLEMGPQYFVGLTSGMVM
jgi:hypothetical protein